MTSDSNPPDMPDQPSGMPQQPAPDPTPEASPVTDAMADAKAALTRAGFTTPTGMIALAALILIGVEIIFGLIVEEFYISNATLLVAFAAVIIFYGKGAFNRIGPAPDLLKLAGYLIAALGLLDVIYDLRYASSNLNEVAEILGALFALGAYALAFLGARAIKT